MRIGMFVTPAMPLRTQLAMASFLEALGFDDLWFPDHMLFPEGVEAPDVWSVMAAVAARTRRIGLGTAVTDPHRTHPAVMAQRLATLDRLSGGRVVLGLGSGEAMNLDAFGFPTDRRVGRTREFLQVVRGLLDTEDPWDFEGDFFRLRGARISVRPSRRVPILMAALGPMMQRLAGRVADGWIPVLMPPEHFAGSFRPMAEAAREAGRDPGSLARVASVAVALGDVSDEQLDRMLRPIGLTLLWPEVLERLGMAWNPPAHLTVDYRNVDPCTPESLALYKELCRWIPREMLLSCVHRGDAASVQDLVRRYEEAGATHLQIFNFSPDLVGSTVALATRVAPHFTGRPAPVAARALEAAMPLLRRTGVLERLVPSPFRRRQSRSKE